MPADTGERRGFKWDGDASTPHLAIWSDSLETIRMTPSSTACDVRILGDVPASNYIEWDASEQQLAIVVGSRTITGEDHCLDISYAGTVAAGGSDAMVGCNVAVTPSGTGANWVSGVYGKVTMAVGAVTGYFCGAEFEIIVTGSVAPCANAVLVLNNNNATTGGAQTEEAYIFCRDYGAHTMKNLFWFADQDSTDNYNTGEMIVETGSVTVSHLIKTIVGSAHVPIYIMCTSTAPQTA